MNKLAVLGYPIDHSLSPQIHQSFAKQFNITLCYEKISVHPKAFIETVTRLKNENYLGFNITLPLKTLAYDYADTLTTQAELAGAVNTIHFDNKKAVGANTDGLGFLHDITAHQGINLENKSILVLGAGGAVRGILPEVQSKHPKKIYLLNRTNAKAEKLANELNLTSCEVLTNLNDIAELELDILINGIAKDGFNELSTNHTINLSNVFCYDLNYGQFHQSFLQVMHRSHCTNFTDGFGMLLGQAALAFEMWFGQMPNISQVRASFNKTNIDNDRPS